MKRLGELGSDTLKCCRACRRCLPNRAGRLLVKGATALLLVSADAALIACVRAVPQVRANGEASIAPMVTSHCMDCHKRSVSDTLPNALAVFDLDQPGWLAGIPSKHLEVEGAFMARLLPFADSKTARRLRAVLDSELERRRHAAN